MIKIVESALLGLLFLLPLGASAQSEVPKVDLFVGYSAFMVPLSIDPVDDARHGLGVNATYNLTSFFGITADVGAQSFDAQQFLFGPQLTLRREKVNFFGHVLFGAARFTERVKNADFAMGYGLGFDINLNERLAIRPMQVDYIPVFMNATKETGHNLRYQGGVVFRF